MKFTSKEFGKMLAQRHDCTIAEANYLIEDFIDLLLETVENGDEIGFQKFGSFQRVIRKEKKGIHPVTRKKIVRPAYSTLTFKSSPANKRIEYDEILKDEKINE